MSTDRVTGADDPKAVARSFMELVTAGRVREAYDRHVADDFRHHNPWFPGDRASLLAGMEANAARFPAKVLAIRHLVGDGDLVAVHSHVRLSPGEAGLALFHLFRFEGGRIAELWDVGQPVPADSPNALGMF